MRSTIDKAGRLVIAKPLRDQLGLRPGDVELTADGAALRVVPIHDGTLVEADRRLVIPASGVPIGDELVQALRDAEEARGQRRTRPLAQALTKERATWVPTGERPGGVCVTDSHGLIASET